MNPPAAIDTVFNRIARREALPAGPVVDFDTALPPLEFQVEARFLRKTSFRFLAPAQAQTFLHPFGLGGRACAGLSKVFIFAANHRPARARMSTRLSVLSASGSSGLLVVPRARRQRVTRSPSAVRRSRTTSARSRFCLR